MIVDCDGCAVRGPACSDCVVSVLLGMPEVRDDRRAAGGHRPCGAAPDGAWSPAAGDGRPAGHRGCGCASAPFGGGDLDEAEQAALGALAGAGLVPPLRLVPVGAPTGAARRRRGTTDAAVDGRPDAPAYDSRRGGATRAG